MIALHRWVRHRLVPFECEQKDLQKDLQERVEELTTKYKEYVESLPEITFESTYSTSSID